MEKKSVSRSALCSPRILIRFALLFSLLLGLLTIAGNPDAAVAGAQESSMAQVTSPDRDEEERREPAPDNAQEIEAMKMRQELRAQTEAAQPIPRGPTAVPPNDTCAGAEVIPTTLPAVSAVYDITDATTTGDPPLPAPGCTTSTTLSRSVWFKFTPAVTQSYVLSTCAAETASTLDDAVMAIYTSTGLCSGPFTQFACDDDSCAVSTLQARIVKNLVAGTTYYIVVWDFDNAAPLPGHESVQLRVSVLTPPANDTCAGAIPLTLNRLRTGSFLDASNDYRLAAASPCFPATVGQTADAANGNDLVYSFTAPSAGSYSFKVWNTSPINPVLYLANTCPPATPGTPVTVTCTQASNRSTVAEEINCVSLGAGQVVFLFVDGNAVGDPASFFVQVENCGTQETEANNTPATADAAACGFSGSIVPAGDIDFVSLGTPAANSRVFAMVDSAASASADVDLRVTTATDTLEYDDLNNDTPWGSLGPNIAGTIVPAVPIFLRLNHFNAGSQADPYHLYHVIQPPIAQATAESEPNNTTATANSANNNYFSGTLSGPAPSTDKDVYGFTANAGDLIYVGLDGDPLRDNTPINAKISLLDVNGAVLIAANDAGGTSNTTTGAGSLTATTPNSPSEGILFRAPTTAVYYVEVAIGTTSTASVGAGDYLLSIAKNCVKGGGSLPDSRIDLFKLTNGTDNDAPPGPSVPVGSTVTFTYVVTNTGSQPLQAVTVRDDNGTPANPADDFNATFTGGDSNGNGMLDLTETWVFSAARIATAGQYTNRGTVSATDSFGQVVTANNPDNHFGVAPSPTPTATATATPTSTPTATPRTLLGNISTRLRVETGDNVLIGGLIITGSQPKKVIVRGIGTSLGLADKLQDPILELRGPSGLIETNDNWMDSSNKQSIIDSGIPPSNNLESAIVATLDPGNNYTAILRGVNNTTGIGVVEAYDLDTAANSKLANISTRGFVQTGDNILIAGTIVVGPNTRKVLVRAIGPSLTVPGKLGDPTLELRDMNGALVRANDNWRTDQEAEIMATTIPPTNDAESALVEILQGNNSNYTAIVRGVNNTTGIAVVEVYALDN